MNTKHAAREAMASKRELAQRLAELERRVAVHDEILNFLKTILEQLKGRGYRLAMTAAQHAELNRWLNECERNARSKARSSELH